MKFLLINIDDEVVLDSTNTPSWNFREVTSFLTALSNDEVLISAIRDPENIVCFLIDEHLPWGQFRSGKEVYEFIGIYSQTLPEEARGRIFPIGVSSGNTAQLYMPEKNRQNKRFQIIMAHKPEFTFMRKEGQQFYSSVAEIFYEGGFYDYELGVNVEYSKKARKLVDFWEGNSLKESEEIEIDDSNIA